jgi:hypothetical protein
MTTQSNVCACAARTGSEYTYACQNAVARPAAVSPCGEVCTCGPTCTCNGGKHPNPQKSEGR